MTTQLAELTKETALTAFTGDTGLDQYVKQVKDEVNSFDHDLSTAAGRAKTISLASKVAKIKVKYDNCGKDLVAEWKTNASKVDKARKKMRDELDDLKVLARKPVTDWEAEQLKIEEEKQAKLEADMLAVQKENDHEVGLLMDERFDRELTEAVAKQLAEAKIEEDRLKQVKIDNDIFIAKQATEEAERLAQQVIDDAQAQKQQAIDDKIKSDNELLAAQARENLLKEQAEQARLNNEWLAFISEAYQINDDLNAKAWQKEQQRLAEVSRLESIENERLAGIERQRVAQKKLDDDAQARAANIKHKAKINNAILKVLLDHDINEKDAKTMVTLAAKRELPSLVINY